MTYNGPWQEPPDDLEVVFSNNLRRGQVFYQDDSVEAFVWNTRPAPTPSKLVGPLVERHDADWSIQSRYGRGQLFIAESRATMSLGIFSPAAIIPGVTTPPGAVSYEWEGPAGITEHALSPFYDGVNELIINTFGSPDTPAAIGYVLAGTVADSDLDLTPTPIGGWTGTALGTATPPRFLTFDTTVATVSVPAGVGASATVQVLDTLRVPAPGDTGWVAVRATSSWQITGSEYPTPGLYVEVSGYEVKMQDVATEFPRYRWVFEGDPPAGVASYGWGLRLV